MKKIISLVLCLVLVAVCFSGCVVVNFGGVAGKGELKGFEFEIGEITGIRVEIACDIKYSAGSSNKVTLEIQENLREYVTVEEVNGVLVVSSSKNISGKTAILTVSAPVLKSVSISGKGDFTAEGKITADSFKLNISGMGNCSAELDVDRLIVGVSGSGKRLEFSGRADAAEFTLSGTGTVNAFDLQTRETTVGLSGSGTVRVNCSEKLAVNGSGVGTVEYKGSPSLDINNSGLVKVKKAE